MISSFCFFFFFFSFFFFFFFFNDTATTEIYTLSLHDALPILIVLNIIFYTFIIIVFIQLIYYGFIFSRFAFAKSKTPTQKNIAVSVIICAKNEAENLQQFLPLILEQEIGRAHV